MPKTPTDLSDVIMLGNQGNLDSHYLHIKKFNRHCSTGICSDCHCGLRGCRRDIGFTSPKKFAVQTMFCAISSFILRHSGICFLRISLMHPLTPLFERSLNCFSLQTIVVLVYWCLFFGAIAVLRLFCSFLWFLSHAFYVFSYLEMWKYIKINKYLFSRNTLQSFASTCMDFLLLYIFLYFPTFM